MYDPRYHNIISKPALLLLVLQLLLHGTIEAKDIDDFFGKDSVHATCDIYMAPSKLGGWGVFAARDFSRHETIEIAPRFLPLEEAWLEQSVMNDYYYGYTWLSNKRLDSFGVIATGMTLFYNHGGAQQNVKFVSFGHEPTHENPMYAQAVGFIALRDIERGEELLSRYGWRNQWFEDRGLVVREMPDMTVELSQEQLQAREETFCSRAYSGIGQSTFEERLLTTQEGVYITKNLPIQDQPSAVAKANVQAGQVIEMAPALVLPSKLVRYSSLAPMSFFWDDWKEQQQATLHHLKERGALRLKVLMGRPERFEYGYKNNTTVEETALVPMGGSIGTVRKVGHIADNNSNCRIEIMASNGNDSDEEQEEDIGSAGIILKLIATKDIAAGQELRLDIPDGSAWVEKLNLLQLLASTGQPIPSHIVDTKDYVPEQDIVVIKKTW